jgi:hypothetical protein
MAASASSLNHKKGVIFCFIFNVFYPFIFTDEHGFI